MTQLDVNVPAPRPGDQPLVSNRLILRRLQPADDAGELFAASHGTPQREAVWDYLGYGPFADVASFLAWLEQCAATRDPHFLCVEDRQHRTRLGMAAWMRIEPAMRVLEIGHIWYRPEAQRTHVNTETVFMMLRHAFDDLGYRRVEWKCDERNAGSKRAALRLGFVFEGVFRQHLIVKGRNRDTAWFAMLDRDWPRARANLETYLAAPPGELSLTELTAASVD